MTKSSISFSVVGIVASVLLLVAAPAFANHSWGNYHWARSANPLSLSLGDNVTSAWDAYLSTASSDWNVSDVLDTAVLAGGTNGTRGRDTPKYCNPTKGLVEVCNSKYGSNGWLGVASIWISGNHITQGTVKLNDTYFNTTKYNTSAWRNLVMCQEIGHTFGIDHQDEAFNNSNLGTCMDYTSAPAGGIYNGFDYGPSNEHPNAHDYDELGAIYAHLDSFNSSFTSLASRSADRRANIDTSDAREWGREIRASRDGRSILYERDLGGGEKVLTFVTWAD
ncbi:MAG: hypothetical protein Q7S01_01025 [bacterium]|nr:hypothetical protein [bacterium]